MFYLFYEWDVSVNSVKYKYAAFNTQIVSINAQSRNKQTKKKVHLFQHWTIEERHSKYHSSWFYVCFNYLWKKQAAGFFYTLNDAITFKFPTVTIKFDSIHQF